MSSRDSEQAKLTSLSRQELYDQVWQTPVRKLAEQFGVSDVGLAKICKKHSIPRPPVGYWAKVAFGKRVKRTPLPNLDDEALEEVQIFRSAFFGESGALATPDPSHPPIVVPAKLSSPHRLVKDTRTFLKSARKGGNGVLQPDLARCLAIRVTRSSLPRALRITDTFIKEWEQIGGKVVVGQRQTYGSPQTIVELHGDGVDVELSEEIKRVALDGQTVRHWSYGNFRYEATGRLILEVGGGTWDGLRHRWADGKRQRLENVLDSFIQGLGAILEAHRLRRLDKECTERQKAKVDKVRERAKQRRELEDQRRAALTQQVANWRESQEIRSYLAALSRKIDDRELQPTNPSAFPAWMDWATWYADYLDPLTPTPDRPEFIEPTENTSIAEVDVTRDVRSLVQRLPVTDTDGLYPLQKADIEEHCGRLPYGTWNEICRMLEGLGYNVAGRYDRW